MKFKAYIKMDNAAFDEMPEYELSRILENIALSIKDGSTYNTCMDINGNRVGEWEIITD
jgi:hypothetical protein